MNTFKRIFTAAIAVVVLLFAAGCSTLAADPDESGLHYKGGAFTSTKFANCVEPGTRDFNGPGDKNYKYPYGQRTFSFTGAEGSERGPLPVTTGSQEVYVPGFVTFTLSSNCEALREFHERIGLKYDAYEGGGGWNNFINDYVAVPLSAILNEAAGEIEVPEGTSSDQAWYLLYTNADTQRAFEAYVKENLPTEIEQTLGAEFITVNSVSISKPTVAEELRASLTAKEKARLDNEAQEQRNAQVRTQYDTISDCLKTGLDRSGCTLIFLSQSGADIPFLPVPQGGAVNFNNSN